MAFYLLQENGDQLILEDGSGFVLLEGEPVAPSTIDYQGDGKKRKKRRRRDRTRELFEAMEQTIRDEVFGEAVPDLSPAPALAVAAVPAVEPELERLEQYAREDEVLQARLARLQADLAAFASAQRAAAQREAELRDDEDRWMLLL